MSCRPHCIAIAVKFDSRMAENDLRRFRRRGPDPSTRLIVEELTRMSPAGRSVIDVGGGIGVIGHQLLRAGVASLVHVEASPAYLEVAKRQLAGAGAAASVDLRSGNFVDLEGLSPADIVTLDRVVCCYPDAPSLLGKAASLCRDTLALSFPRDRWYVRLVVAAQNLFRRVAGDLFRGFVHPAATIAATLERAGMRRIAQCGTIIWQVEVYQRVTS